MKKCNNCGCKGRKCICDIAGCVQCCGKCEKTPRLFVPDKTIAMERDQLDKWWQKEFGNDILNNTLDEIEKK